MFNRTRLELARRRLGLTKRALAVKARVAERSVAGYESGELVPPPVTVARLARALRFPESFFERPDVESIPQHGASWRALTRTTAAQLDRALAGGQLALELNAWIDARFNLPKPDVPDLRPQPNPEAAADALRIYWGIGDKPIPDMVRLLEAKGVRVFSLAEQGDEVDAFSFWRGGQPFVFLNTMKSGERSRYDAAHELGHLVLHPAGNPNGRRAEYEANLFAGAFLMPRSSLLAFAPRRAATIPDLVQAKKIWKVSLAALVYRLHEAGLIKEWHHRRLWVEMEKLGYRTTEPQGCQREMSQVFEKVFTALREEGVSKAKLARELAWPLRELNALVFQLVVAAVEGSKNPITPASGDEPPMLTLLRA